MAKNILVVEDEALSRMGLMTFLSDEGYSVDSTESGENAVKMLQIKNFDAVIADFKLTGQANGLDVLAEFERITPGRGKILTTAYLSQQVAAESVGAVYMAKPIDFDDLLQKLKSILR